MYVKYIPEQQVWEKNKCIRICLLFAPDDFEDEEFWTLIIKDALINCHRNFSLGTKFRVGLGFNTQIDTTEVYSFTVTITKQSTFVELITRVIEEFKKGIRTLKPGQVEQGGFTLILCNKQTCNDNHLDLASLTEKLRIERPGIIKFIESGELPPHINPNQLYFF